MKSFEEDLKAERLERMAKIIDAVLDHEPPAEPPTRGIIICMCPVHPCEHNPPGSPLDGYL